MVPTSGYPMPRLAKLDRLLAVLRERIFLPSAVFASLQYRPAANDERGAVPNEDRSGWAKVDRDLIWGEPDGYFWFDGQIVVPEALAGKALFGRVHAQFGSVMGRSDPQLLVRIDGRIAQGGDGNHR